MHCRPAEENDAGPLLDLLREMHAEIGLYELAENKLAMAIEDGLQHGRVIVLEHDGAIGGSIGLFATELWFTNQTVLVDHWIFIRPQHRSKEALQLMIAMAKDVSIELALPLHVQLFTTKRLDAKARLFAQLGDEVMRGFAFVPCGAEFVIQGPQAADSRGQ